MAMSSNAGWPRLWASSGPPLGTARGRVVAWLGAQAGAGKTTLATQLAGEFALQGRRVVLLDADPRGAALDWAQRRVQRALPRLHGVYGLARESLRQEAPCIARDADWVLIDGPSSVGAPMHAAMLAADLVLIPVQPGACDLQAIRHVVRHLAAARALHPALRAAFVVNRRVVGSPGARAVRAARADHPLPTLRAQVRERVVFADSFAAGRLVCEAAPLGAAACEIAALAQAVREAIA